MKEKTRRIFLRNIGLAGIGLGFGSSPKKETSNGKLENISCDVTTLDYFGEGPFYTDSPPFLNDNMLADENEPGVRLTISGRILNLDCSEFIPNTIVDVWHANNAGQYDNQAYNLRGYVKSNDQGYYLFETVYPGKYLNGNAFRPSHIHFKITPPNYPTLTTQLYFEGDDSIPADAAASITSGQFDATARIIPLTENSDGSLEGTFDIVVDGKGIVLGVNDLHINRGMIYEISPNPFKNELKIHYGVFQKATVGIYVHDIHGKLIAELSEKEQTPEKYNVYWKPDASLAAGHYFIALKINDLQVHYIKVQKQ